MKERRTNRRVYGGVRADPRVNGRRKRLIAAGIEAFGTRGYARTSIQTIRGTAGLTGRYFYESFGSKEELLPAVCHGIIEGQVRDAMKALEQETRGPLGSAMSAPRAFSQDFRKRRCVHFFSLARNPYSAIY